MSNETTPTPKRRPYDKSIVWNPRGNIMFSWGTAAAVAFFIWQASEAFTELKGEVSALVKVNEVQFVNLNRRLTEITARLDRVVVSSSRRSALPMASTFVPDPFRAVINGVVVKPHHSEE